ncbi:MAG: hypothetical protein AAF483_23155, partial [Planctomycetota bacterium]
MHLAMVGWSYQQTPVEIRERLAFSNEQAFEALQEFTKRFPNLESVLLSTCNRVELYCAASGASTLPETAEIGGFITDFHGLSYSELQAHVTSLSGSDSIRHLFTVAASLDSMVIGEAQILSQVKAAYELACQGTSVAKHMHSVFQRAALVAKRVATETEIHQKRVSVPSVAVSEIATDFFERFDPVDPSRTFATLEDFERCELGGIHTNGNEISSRLYNPLDRAWCRDQALNPSKVHHEGPFVSAWSTSEWVMTIGKAVFDKITNDFIGCIAVGFVLDSIDNVLHASKTTEHSEVSVIRFNENGDVVASTAWNRSESTETKSINDLNVGLTQESYQTFRKLVNYRMPWDPDETIKKYEKHLLNVDGYLVAAYPMPPVPETYDPIYAPEFL